ncbi:MAG: aldo/keto reductase [bacterium]
MTDVLLSKACLFHTDLNSSAVCLGTALMGSTIAEAHAFQMLDSYVEAGGNFLDSARVYADWLPGGTSASERTVGNWIKTRKNRPQIILATKGGHPPLSEMGKSRLARKDLEQDIELSLGCLAVDQIDLYWLHRDDPARDVGEIMETMDALIQSGKIRYFGCSNWRVNRVAEALAYSSAHGLAGFVAMQNLWSLAHADMKCFPDDSLQTMDPAAIHLCQEKGLAIIPYSSQANGFFTKCAHAGKMHYDSAIKGPYESALNYARLRAAVRIAKRMSASVTDVALAYLISQRALTIPVIGPRSNDQLMESLRNPGLRLDRETLCELEAGDIP